MIDVTFSIQTDGCVHYRVLASQEEDWSGWANSLEEATASAMRRVADIRERGRELFPRCNRCYPT